MTSEDTRMQLAQERHDRRCEVCGDDASESVCVECRADLDVVGGVA